MEENSSTDDEVKNSCSEKTGSKKIKLNNGSSQDSLSDTVASSNKDENADSGLSADKSESTSSNDRATEPAAGPSNEVVNIAPSGSNVQTILLNIHRPRRGRNYRKRKTPGWDEDSPSSRDSDDLSAADSQPMPNGQSTSDTESDMNVQFRFREFGSTESDASNSGVHSSPSNNDYGFESETDRISLPGNTDSDVADTPTWRRDQEGDNDGESESQWQPPVLMKQRPKHDYLILREIINREMGLTFPCHKTTKEDVMFERRFYNSLHAIYRMKKLHCLTKHKGCVNSINFHPEGRLLVSGSDDMNIVVWEWAKNVALQTIKTGHKSNIFQSKFLHLNAQSQLNIVTCARDGQVRLIQCPSSGGSGTRRRLCTHARAAHKLHVSPNEPHVVISAGEDGLVMQCDVRHEHATRLFQAKDKNHIVPLYSVHGHPLKPRELVVAGRDTYLRVYDRRKSLQPLAVYCPATLQDGHDSRRNSRGSQTRMRYSLAHLTCAVYNHDGTEILGSYNDEDIYLFNTKDHAKDPSEMQSDTSLIDTSAADIEKIGYAHSYTGHRNSATFKGVSFLGPNSEYIVSGSDCSNIYIWHKETEAIVQWVKGDTSGVVNCIETHPRHPVMATSGLDRDVKIWLPGAQQDPTFEGLEKTVCENVIKLNRLIEDFSPVLNDSDSEEFYGGNIEVDGDLCATM